MRGFTKMIICQSAVDVRLMRSAKLEFLQRAPARATPETELAAQASGQRLLHQKRPAVEFVPGSHRCQVDGQVRS